MADTSTAQDVLICDVCEVSPVQRYCNKCSTNLCDGCIVKHITSDNTKSHDIVIYKNKNEDPIFLECETHHKTCEMQCKNCDIPVCTRCVTTGSHEHHKLIDLHEVFNTHKSFISEETKDLETSIYPSIKLAVSDLQTKIKNLPKSHEKLMTAITQQGVEWHKEIDIIIKGLKTEAEKMKTDDLTTLQNLLSDMNNFLSTIYQAIVENKELLKSNKFIEMKSYKSRIPEFEIYPTNIEITPPTFTPVPIKGDQLYKMFGTFKSSSMSKHGHVKKMLGTTTHSEQKLLDSPKEIPYIENTGYKTVYDVACLHPNEVWVRGDDSQIKCFNEAGSPQQTIITTTGNMPFGITVTPKGDLVYSDYRDKSINKVKDGKIQKMITLRDWKPNKVCYTASGDLLVSMALNKVVNKKIVHYIGSTEKQTIQFDKYNKPLFSTGTNVLFIAENRNLDICASDLEGKQVVVINQAGKQRFNYTGNLSMKKYSTFSPTGIATDSESRILVADHDNGCIHIIDEDGHFIRYIDNCSLRCPIPISLDINNILYVGERYSTKVKKIQYLSI